MIIHLAQPLFDTDSKKITFEFQKKKHLEVINCCVLELMRRSHTSTSLLSRAHIVYLTVQPPRQPPQQIE